MLYREAWEEPKSAIIVIQDIFGVNAGIRRKCDLLAEHRFLAVCPRPFLAAPPRVELDPDIEPEFRTALEFMGKFDQDQGIRDIEAAIRYARTVATSGKVGAVGYCLGVASPT